MSEKGSTASLGNVAIWGGFTTASGRSCEKNNSASVNEFVPVACRMSNEYLYMRPSASGPLGSVPLAGVRRRMAVRHSCRTAELGR
ncbi:hypothetical protein IMCC3135_07520 [Granulosicoccus antarcticus IMCC3135]|uniref:Uncharacterized protein n=1 Tax=Granulosicoccus antarcticus IMCC3135 TaxID=1192854 RepID=A0A2Z2NKB0_9GAMM|nr:hypothetical protein IMCC3135_07520 [Granulosicoccus antarcticus IMCC3135]